jgi:flagellar biosynthesis/type III secretory pathway M-ring protein FliF/YscJ
MKLLKLKLVAKKVWLWAKKFWWAIILGLLFVGAALIGALTRNAAFLAGVLDLLESKKEAHDAEIETLEGIHNAETAAKSARLEEHLKRKAELEEEFKKKGETLDKQKEAELKRIVDESYNDPEKLAKEIAEAFGLKNG